MSNRAAKDLWPLIVQYWDLLEADFQREYRMSQQDIYELTVRRFVVLVNGLSSNSRFVDAVNNTPRVVEDPDDVAAVTSRLRM